MLNIYINVAIMNNFNSVLSNILTRISKSGLYDNCNKIFLILNGDSTLVDIEIKDKYVLINTNNDISKMEFPTLDLLWEDSQNINCKILYLHTKGVSRHQEKNISDWVNYMLYFNVDKWEDRIKELDSNDCTGVNLQGHPDDLYYNPSTWGYGRAPLHYSGNFWWANSSYIKGLIKPTKWLPNNDYKKWRIMAEMWLCQLEGFKYFNAYSSNTNHYNNEYPENLYKN